MPATEKSQSKKASKQRVRKRRVRKQKAAPEGASCPPRPPKASQRSCACARHPARAEQRRGLHGADLGCVWGDSGRSRHWGGASVPRGSARPPPLHRPAGLSAALFPQRTPRGAPARYPRVRSARGAGRERDGWLWHVTPGGAARVRGCGAANFRGRGQEGVTYAEIFPRPAATWQGGWGGVGLGKGGLWVNALVKNISCAARCAAHSWRGFRPTL